MQKLAFDIGCNIGKYTKKLLENGWNVVAVDPNPYLFCGHIPGVIRVYAACSNSIGNIPFYFSNTDTISTASEFWVKESRFAGKHIWHKNEVPSTTIDELVKINGVPDHIKIDVEGYELIVLHGMTKKYANEICFEWAEEQGDDIKSCIDYLSSLGYSKFGFILGDEYLKEPEVYSGPAEFMDNFYYNKDRKDLWGMIWAK